MAANATTRNCLPLPPTGHCQHVAGGIGPPTAKGRQIVQVMELANLCALLHKLQPPTLLAVLAQGDLVLVHMEGYVLYCSVLSYLLLWNGVLLAVAALERLALPVRHSMRTPSCAGALCDGQKRLWVPCHSGPSPCLLHSLCHPGAMLCTNCKLAVHDTTICKQQIMKGVQANTLCAATHLLVGVGEMTNASLFTDDVAECTLTHLIFDCWIILDDVGEDGSKANLRQQLRDCHLLAIRILQLEHVPCVWRHDDVGVVLEGRDQQGPDISSILEYPFLHLASAQKIPALLVDSFWCFSMRAFSLLARVLCVMPSTRAQSCWLDTPVTFSREGALKVSITLAASCFSSVVFARVFLQLQSRSIRQEECSQTNL